MVEVARAIGDHVSVELSVLIPCYNEEGNLPELVERTRRVFERKAIAGEIVLVNDASTDGTRAQIDALTAAHPDVVGVHHATNRGIAGGWQSAFAHSRGRYVCTIDADLQYQPEAIAQLYREMCFSKADLVQGWRSSLERHQYDIRYYMSRGLDYLLKFAFGMHEHDVKSGFVVYKREVFEDILRDAPLYFYFQHMITVVAKARGYTLRQVETLFEERRAGQSFIGFFPVRMIGRTFVDIARAVVETRLREPTDKSLTTPGGDRPRVEPAGDASRTSLRYRVYRSLMPAHHAMLSRNAPRYLDDLRRTQWLSPEEIEQLQLRRLRRLVQHATEHVGYWRETLQGAGVSRDDVHSLADLRRVPVLTKQALRDNIYFDLLADNSNKRKIQKLVTCGSTGEPLGTFVDRLQLDMRWANEMRNTEWAGWRFGDHQAQLRCAAPGPGGPSMLRAQLEAVLADRLLLPMTSVDGGQARRVAEELRRRPATLVEGDTEALYLVARALTAQGGPPLTGRAIVTGGQTSTAATREAIERAFGGRVFDRYRAGEFGSIAQECEAHAGYHVNAESFIVEVVRDGRPAAAGEVGEVIVTDLSNRCVPLLRYRLGDLATMSARRCACGRGLPLLERVSGRSQGAVVAADGRAVPATVFMRLFAAYEYAVVAFQVVQEATDRVDVRIVRRSRFSGATEQQVRDALAGLLGSGTAVRLELVDRIPSSVGGRAVGVVSAGGQALFPGDDALRWDGPGRHEAAS